MQQRLIALLGLVAMLAWAVPVSAQMMGGGRDAYGGQRLSAQEQRIMDELEQEYRNETAPLQSELDAAYEALAQQMYSRNPDQEELERLIQRIDRLRGEILRHRVDMRMKIFQRTGATGPVRDSGGYGMRGGSMMRGGSRGSMMHGGSMMRGYDQ